MSTRTIETLGDDLKTVNVWHVPRHITLDKAMKSQDDPEFRALYFASSHLVKPI